jgi:hypothetical protein
MSTTMYDVLADHDSVDDTDPRQERVGWSNDEDDVPVELETPPWCQLTDQHCRFFFTTKQQTDVIRVCGNLRAECTRKGHKSLTARRGDPGFYAEMQPVTKNSKVDGNESIYKTVEDMEAELQASDARVTAQMEELAKSPAFQQAAPAFQQEVAPAYQQVVPPEVAPADEEDTEADTLGPIRRFTTGLETQMSTAKRALLTSPAVGGGSLKKVGDRVRSFRTALFGVSTATQQTEEMNKLIQLEAAAMAAEAQVEYHKSMQAVAARLNRSNVDSRAFYDRNNLQAEMADITQNVLALEELSDDDADDEPEESGVASGPATLHEQPSYLASLESQWRTLKGAAQQHESASQTTTTRRLAQIATVQNKMVRAEKLAASRREQDKAEMSARLVALKQQAAAEEAEEWRAEKAAMQEHIRELEAQAAIKAAAKQARVVATSAKFKTDSAVTKLTEQCAQVKEEASEKVEAQNAYPPRGNGSAGMDPRMAILQAKFEDLEALVSNTQQKKKEGQHLSPPTVKEPPEVVAMKAKIQALEAQLQAATTTSYHKPLDEPNAAHQGTMQTQHKQSEPGGVAGGHFSYADIEPATDDTSTGDEVYGVKLHLPRKVLDALCPKGMSDSAKQQIAEAGLDVVSLPGKYRASNGQDLYDNETLANNLGRVLEIAGDRAQGAASRDHTFQSDRRNALDSVKTEAQLREFRDDLEEAWHEALRSSEYQMRQVLHDHCVENEVIEYFIKMSRFPTMIRETLKYYKALIDHVICLSADSGGFAYAFIDFQYYAGKLALRRRGSRTRLEVLLKVYCILRDGHRTGFIDPKLQQKKNAYLCSKVAKQVTPRGNTPAPGGDPDRACSRCSTKLHVGKACPFNHARITYANARRMASNCKDAPDFAVAAAAAVQDFLAALPPPAAATPNPRS